MTDQGLEHREIGVAIALLLLGGWSLSLSELLSHTRPWAWMLLAILWQTWLYTGLFITAHDAMHGSISPGQPRVNRLLGQLALSCYGLLPYRTLLQAHHQHHRQPGTQHDPDFYGNGVGKGEFWRWYYQFMQHYWCWWRCSGLLAIYLTLHLAVKVTAINLIAFCFVPSLLSSLQLFYFGTYLPHRHLPDCSPATIHNIQRSPLWSLVSCYNFGLHVEHHTYPHIPWWQLPQIADAPALAVAGTVKAFSVNRVSHESI